MEIPQCAPIGERLSEVAARPQDFLLLERVPWTAHGGLAELSAHLASSPLEVTAAPAGADLGSIVFMDTETTGLRLSEGELIELGMARLTYDRATLTPVALTAAYDEFQEPSAGIPPQITKITSITNGQVAGHAVDWAAVAGFVEGADYMASHNAAFDRPFFEQALLRAQGDVALLGLRWADTLTGVRWRDRGFALGSRLEALLVARGYFYQAHRAFEDCLALAFLISIEPGALGELIASAQARSRLVTVRGPTFGFTADLKRLGLRFCPQPERDKRWEAELPEARAQEAVARVETLAALGGVAGRVRVELSAPLDASCRFKGR